MWDSASEKDFRARQIWIVLVQLFQTAILIAMAYLTSGIAMAGLWLSVFAFFAIGMYVAFSYSLLISEVSYLEDAQEASQRFFHPGWQKNVKNRKNFCFSPMQKGKNNIK